MENEIVCWCFTAYNHLNQKNVEIDVINIPQKLKGDNLGEIYIPNWVKTIATWWLEEKISDGTFANAFQNLIDREIIAI